MAVNAKGASRDVTSPSALREHAAVAGDEEVRVREGETMHGMRAPGHEPRVRGRRRTNVTHTSAVRVKSSAPDGSSAHPDAAVGARKIWALKAWRSPGRRQQDDSGHRGASAPLNYRLRPPRPSSHRAAG